MKQPDFTTMAMRFFDGYGEIFRNHKRLRLNPPELETGFFAMIIFGTKKT